MGQSPSADLFYGYDLGTLADSDTYDDLRPAWMQEDDYDEEKHLAAVLGWTEVPYVEASDHAGHKAWSDNLSELWALTGAHPIELDHYGYMDGGDSTFAVRVKASVQSASDYGSTEIQPLVVDPAWNDQLAEFMRLMELPIPDGVTPGWHMNCSYG